MKQMLKKIINKIENTSILKNETLIYAGIFVMIAGFMINGILLSLSRNISNDFYNLVDGTLLIVDILIIGGAILRCLIKKASKVLISYLIFIAIYAFSFLFYNENKIAIQSIFVKFFLQNVTTFILFYSVDMKEKLFKFCEVTCKILFGLSMIYFLLDISNASYNVWLSKHFFIVAVFLLHSFHKEHLKNTIIIYILCLPMLIYTGSRTYLLLYSIYSIIYFTIDIIKWFKAAKKISKIVTIIVIIIIIIITTFLMQNYKKISKDVFYYFLKQHNIRIRILRLMYEEDIFFTSSTREKNIYPTVYEAIWKKWVTGYGICGDRPIIYNKMLELGYVKEGYTMMSYYSHNLILEICCDFGIVGGIVLLLLFGYCYYTNIRQKKNKRDMIICLTLISIFPLMFNGSYLDNIFFWGLLGTLISQEARKRHSSKNKLKDEYTVIKENEIEVKDE